MSSLLYLNDDVWLFFGTMSYTKDNFCFQESLLQWQIKLISKNDCWTFYETKYWIQICTVFKSQVFNYYANLLRHVTLWEPLDQLGLCRESAHTSNGYIGLGTYLWYFLNVTHQKSQSTVIGFTKQGCKKLKKTEIKSK